jgi:putative hydrolase of the HAD superfamily
MPNTIHNIIFDLGGLFIDVYMHRFQEQLAAALQRPVEEPLKELQATGLFDRYETGKLDSATFLSALQQALAPAVRVDTYAACWNAILGQVQLEQLQAIQALRAQKQVVLLSNTNALHVAALEADFARRHPGLRLHDFFQSVYYSQEIGLRKPDAEVFAFVLQQQGFAPAETLFIDDSPEHLAGAQALGIHTHLHARNAPIHHSLDALAPIIR